MLMRFISLACPGIVLLMLTTAAYGDALDFLGPKQGPQFYIDSNVYLPEKLQQQLGDEANKQSFYLLSHGRPGELFIDGEWLNAKQIKTFLAAKLKHGDSLRVLIYGCDFAKGEKGLDAVAYLQVHLRLPVYASDDVTGHSGDWELEVGRASISGLAVADYPYNL